MKGILLLMAVVLLCTSCTALPAEERAFAVALMVERDGETWQVHSRIPTYQTGGGYLTLTGKGDSLEDALAALDAASPMHLNLSQLRLLVLNAKLAETGDLPGVLEALSARSDMRQACRVALTGEAPGAVMQALNPAVGSRLSKTLDILLDTRSEQGMIPQARLSDLMRMGERQTPVLSALSLQEERLQLSGGFALTSDLRAFVPLSAEEMTMLSLLLGEAKMPHLAAGTIRAEVREASSDISLSDDLNQASAALVLRVNGAEISAQGLAQNLADALCGLLNRLSASGCDVLGMGREAVVHTHDMTQWRALKWPEQMRRLRWSVTVRVEGPA